MQNHSGIDRTVPGNDTVLAEAPPHLVLTFNKPIRLTRIRMTHDDHDAVDLDLGDRTVFATRFVVPFSDMGSGHYRIEWRGLSSDGHVMRKALAFRVE